MVFQLAHSLIERFWREPPRVGVDLGIANPGKIRLPVTRSTIGLHILFSSNLDKSYQFQQNLQEFFKSLEKFDKNRKNLHKNFCRVAQY